MPPEQQRWYAIKIFERDERVREYLKIDEKKLSQEVFSGLAALDRTHYSKIERGERIPTLETIFKIATALEMAPSEVVHEIEKDLM